MIAFPHMLVGAAFGTKVKSVPAAFGLGVVSHFLMDMVPHFDYDPKLYHGAFGFLDLAIGILLVWLLVRKDRILWAGAIGAIVPDIITMVEDKLGINVTTGFHQWIHTGIAPSTLVGVVTQVVAVCIAVLVIYHHKKAPSEAS